VPTAADKPLAEVLEEPPADVAAALGELRAGLDADVPTKVLDRNLLIGTWNIRAFGDLTEKWETGDADTPKRNLADVRAIAEIVSRFDVIAIQEAKANLKALRHMLKTLGPDWGLILTDVNPPPKGNSERLAFVFDTRRVKPSGLAAELVVPEEELEKGRISKDSLQEQFVRTPYAVSFQSAGQTFILVTLHVFWGKSDQPEAREPELKGIAKWLADWAGRVEDYNQNLIALGDFNIDMRGDPNWQAFTSTGLSPPDELQGLSRTIYDHPGKEHYYDQIAWFTEKGRAKLTLDYEGKGHADRFEWTRCLLTDIDDNDRKAARISDHYPLWTEFSVRDI
jgi:endonuclease/exonuclease/phosphatase family metal-dependent hydrolase